MDTQDCLKALVRDLKLDTDPELNKPGSHVLDLALHEESSREIVLWAKLEPFLRAYAEAFPKNGDKIENLEKALEEAMDEPTHFLTQHLIKVHLRGEKPISLGQLAEVRKKRGTPSWEKYKDFLSNDVIFEMHDLQLWNVETIRREEKNGGGTIAGYKISAGQALIDFHKFVYRPKRAEQIQEFCDTYLKGDRRC
jgi:hypothetical protein